MQRLPHQVRQVTPCRLLLVYGLVLFSIAARAADSTAGKWMYFGQVTAVDADAGSISIASSNGVSHTIRVSEGTAVTVQGKAGALTDIKVGMRGGVRMSEDESTVLEITAYIIATKPPQPAAPSVSKNVLFGAVTGVDAEARTLTLSNDKTGTSTIEVPRDAGVTVDQKVATLAAVHVGMRGYVRLGPDGKSVTEVLAYTPRPSASGSAGTASSTGKWMYFGSVAAVDAAGSNITFTNRQSGSHTVAVPNGTKVTVDQKPGHLADIHDGMRGGARFSNDGKTLLEILAYTPPPVEKNQ